MAVENWHEAAIFEAQDQLVHERGRILARIGDEDLELFARARISHRLLEGIAVRFRAHLVNTPWLRLARSADPPLNYGGQRRSSGPYIDLLRVAPVRARVADEYVVGIVRHGGPVPTNPVVASLHVETHAT